ncbi:MAG: hypothetical protein RBU30_20545 [Polyangia bacterium]|jgi:hypothetical protein|nr:hypothetical protein [Polyangia bacterium]
MKRYFFEAITIVLLAGSIVFFHQTVTYLAKRDYIASLILMLIGLTVMRVGSEMARLAILDRR